MNPRLFRKDVETRLQQRMRFHRPIDQKYPSLREPLDDMFRKFNFMQEPYLEGIPYYAQDTSTSLASLSTGADAVLSPETAYAFTTYFHCKTPAEVHLYSHQVEAVKAVDKGMNLLVCTGTGSGKTESFLIPLIEGIVRERKECAATGKEYRKGIRALILYPMNALVNDQLRRIRSIIRLAQEKDIAYVKDISFGRYTGDVKTKKQEAKADEKVREYLISPRGEAHMKDCFQNMVVAETVDHLSLSDDTSPSTEYTKRSRWEDEGSADILITNYTMLERMMLNPEQDGFFSETLQYIVLDEAHTYDGALGTDIAWLLRRLSLRVRPEGCNRPKITYLATSATLIDDDEHSKTLSPEDALEYKKKRIRTEFAERLFPHEGSRPFFVHLGTGYDATHLWARGASCPDLPDYAGILRHDLTESTSGKTLLDGISEAKKLISGRVQETKSTLLDQTKWLLAAQEWVKGLSYLAQATDFRKGMSFADAVELATLHSKIHPETPLLLEGVTVDKISEFLNISTPASSDFENKVWMEAVEAAMGDMAVNKRETIKGEIAVGQKWVTEKRGFWYLP